MVFQRVDVLVLGAGISGLMAASRLRDKGLSIVVLDKSRGVGGRMATRRWEGAHFDHGAQFFTVRNDRFKPYVESWLADGVVASWACSGQKDHTKGEVCYRGEPSMTAVCKALAKPLDVRKSAKVDRVERAGDAWSVHTEDGRHWQARALLMTAPMPQNLRLLATGCVRLPPEVETSLQAIHYDPCFAVMARLDGPTGLPEPGRLRFDGPMLSIMVDNQMKGISPEPAVTIHTTGAYAAKHWELEKDEIAKRVLNEASPHLHSKVRDWQVMKWKFSLSTSRHHEEYLAVPGLAPLIFAGDGFGASRVESAALSGLAAADALFELL